MLHRSGLAHIRALLHTNRLIRKHLEQRDRDLALLGCVLDQLPDPLRSHCCDVTLADGVLTLYLDSPAWATRARFLADGLPRSLGRDDIVKVSTRIRIADVPDHASHPRGDALRRPVSRKLSAGVAAHLLAAADAMTDQHLGDALRRFAKRHVQGTRVKAGDDEIDAGIPPTQGGTADKETDRS
jgi:hypothetical protein